MTKSLFRWILIGIIFVGILLLAFFLYSTLKIAEIPTSTPTIFTRVIPTAVPSETPKPKPRETTLYVSPDGNNNNPGTIEEPWQTIQFAVDQAVPGDTIYIRSGIYQEKVRVSRNGTKNSPITLTGYSSEEAIIDGGNDTTFRALGNASYWVIDGLTFMSKNRYTMTIGWWDDGLTEYWILRNNNIFGANFIRGAYHLWENNNISGEGYDGTSGDAGISEGGDSHHNIYRNNSVHDFSNISARGIWSQGNTHDSIIEFNTITNINAAGDGIKGQCIDLDGAGKVEWRHTIRGNRISNCNYVGIQLENVFDSTIENNLIINAKAAGIIAINYDASTGCNLGGENNQYGSNTGDCRGIIANNILRQNIIVNSGDVGGIVSYGAAGVRMYANLIDGSNTGLYLEEGAPFSNNWDVRGNIISNFKMAAFSLVDPASLLKEENNLLFTEDNVKPYYVRGNPPNHYSLSKWQSNFEMGYGSIDGNPLFIDPAILNLHLQSESPAIDAEIDPETPLDFDGQPRLSGMNYDIGPFELKK